MADCTVIQIFGRNFKFLFRSRSMQLSLMQFLLESEYCWEAFISHGHWLTIWIYLILLSGIYAFLPRAVQKIKQLRLYTKYIVTILNIIPYWNSLIENVPWKNVWSLPFKYMLTNKVRELKFKWIHRFYQILNLNALYVKGQMKIYPIYLGNVPTQKNSGQMSLNLSKPILLWISHFVLRMFSLVWSSLRQV